MMGTSSSFSHADNVRLVYFMESYLLTMINNAKIGMILYNTSCPLNIQIHSSMLGYKTLKEFSANRFVDRYGERPFKNADDNVKTFIQIYENPDLK